MIFLLCKSSEYEIIFDKLSLKENLIIAEEIEKRCKTSNYQEYDVDNCSRKQVVIFLTVFGRERISDYPS